MQVKYKIDMVNGKLRILAHTGAVPSHSPVIKQSRDRRPARLNPFLQLYVACDPGSREVYAISPLSMVPISGQAVIKTKDYNKNITCCRPLD